ncbi:MAG: tRNA preQ1(34) S-adenosylmethionine ribosyltransferase-isomerase QueA, partial [Acidimicrobiia bacterium]
MQLSDFDYDLPEAAIAQHPAEPRDAARLLVAPAAGPVAHRTVADVPSLVRPGDVVVVNSSRVLPARLHLRKPTGGRVEVLLLERLPSGAWEALVRPSRRLRPGTELAAGPDLRVEVGGPGPGEGTRLVVLHTDEGTEAAELAALERHGTVPLPPYVTEPLADPERYQTVFSREPGSVAAPTAGLHLTTAVLDRVRAAGAEVHEVELAVGMGTFRPMTAPKVEDHHMHAERYRVPPATLAACTDARVRGGRVVAVGTTTVRALESAALSGELEGRTELFIRRPWRWRVVDVLMTNFHLPRSSLLVLVDAFVGDRWRELYATALEAGYRFLSFGDAMWLERPPATRGAGAP